MDYKKRLSEPFDPKDIEWRVQSCGEKDGRPWARVLAYITARAVMDRLDNVFGIDGWSDKYRLESDGAVVCSLSVKINGEWITKEDAAEATDIEPIKGGRSGALKRSAVKFGIGRYLYNLTNNFASISNQGTHYQPADKKHNAYKAFKWNPPMLPSWALPDNADKTKKVFDGIEVPEGNIDDVNAKLEEYLLEYEADGNQKAIDYIKEALTKTDYESVYGALYTIEEKRAGRK